MKILVIDVGGTNIKYFASGQEEPRKFPSGPDMTAQELVDKLLPEISEWEYEAVSIGFPGPVKDGKPVSDPPNLGPGWVDFNFEAALKRPVKIINDAAMQALGSYQDGKMLFLGLGTGLGSTLIIDGNIAPLELGHLPYKKLTFEDYVGARGLERFGKKRWRVHVEDVIARLTAALLPDYVCLGGGNVRKLKVLPPGCRTTENVNAFAGGFRLWGPQSTPHDVNTAF